MQLFVGGLSDDTTENELSGLFTEIGGVESVTIVRDLSTGRSRGFGMVRMTSDAKGEEVIKRLNGTTVAGREIMVTRMPETLPGEMEFREWLREHADEVLKIAGVRKGQTVLDYGCGPGTFTIASARIAGERGRVYALDVRQRALERVGEEAKNEGLRNIVNVLADSSRMAVGLEDESVDVILVYDVMHDIDDRRGLLEELHRVLRRDGFLSIFPMHMGDERMLEIVDESGRFRLRDSYGPPGHKTASRILNFEKILSE
jgi:SAM-dependent methyltransferase